MYTGICLGDVPVIERSVCKTANHHPHSKKEKKKEKKKKEEVISGNLVFFMFERVSYGNAHSEPGFLAFFLFLKNQF